MENHHVQLVNLLIYYKCAIFQFAILTSPEAKSWGRPTEALSTPPEYERRTCADGVNKPCSSRLDCILGSVGSDDLLGQKWQILKKPVPRKNNTPQKKPCFVGDKFNYLSYYLWFNGVFNIFFQGMGWNIAGLRGRNINITLKIL